MKRKLTPDELNELEAQGYNTSSYKGELIEFPDPEKASVKGVVTRAALANAIPATAGAAGFAGGMALAAPFAPATGGLSFLVPIGAGILGGMGSAAITRKAQDLVTPQPILDRLQQDALERPTAARVGEIGASLLTMRPSISVTRDAIKGAAQVIPQNFAGGASTIGQKINALNPTYRAALGNVGLGAGISGATEAGVQLATEGTLHPSKILAETLVGAAFNKPTTLGKKVMRLPSADVGPRDIDQPEVFRQQLGTRQPIQADAQEFRDSLVGQKQFNDSAIALAQESMAKQAEINAAQAAEIARLSESQKQLNDALGAVLDQPVPQPAKPPTPLQRNLPDYIKMQEEDSRMRQMETKTEDPLRKYAVTEEESQADLEMRRIEDDLSGRDRSRYSEDKTVMTPKESEVNQMLGEQNIPTAPTQKFNRSVDNLLQSKNIGVEENKNIPKKGMMRPDSWERKVLINPNKETVDTRAHEGQHYELSEIEVDASRGNVRAKTFLDNLYGKQKELLDSYNAKLSKEGKKPVDAHEFATTEQGAEFIKQQLNLKKEGEWRKWWNDTKSLWSARFGKNPSNEDLQRALNYRFVNRLGMGTIGKTGPLGKVGDVVRPSSTTATERSSEEGKGIPRDEGFNTKEGDDVLSSNEDIPVKVSPKVDAAISGYRKVNVKKPDGTTYEAYFNDKYYDMGEMGKFASIAKITPEGELTHGATKKGEIIEEITPTNPTPEPKTPSQDFSRNSEADRGIEREDAMDFMTSSERILDTVKGAQNARQILNTLKNKIPPAEFDILQKAGIEKEFDGRIVKPEEMKKWIQENGPVAKVETYGMEGKVSEAKKEYDKMTHEWYDNLTPKQKINLRSYEEYGMPSYLTDGDQSIDRTKANRYQELRRQVNSEVIDKTSPRATSAYSHVSAFDTTQPMPEWTKTKSGKNVQRVDVVIPTGRAEAGLPPRPFDTDVKWQPDNLHENLPNTLGWAMIQYKTGPKGEKIAVVVEAQSRWWQTVREADKRAAKQTDPARAEQLRSDGERMAHPLLKDYNRLILKAAIEQARKEGATHIVVSDAETAMMTEGHDLGARTTFETDPANSKPLNEEILHRESITYDNGAAKGFRQRMEEKYGIKVNNINQTGDKDGYRYSIYTDAKYNNGEGAYTISRWPVKENVIDQEPGMRFNYDTALPRIAEELTGSKGEKVSLGEHKNATLEESPTQYDGQGLPYHYDIALNRNVPGRAPRSNLIFRNPDGTPKTDVSGMMFPLEKVAQKKQPFSYFEKRSSESDRGIQRVEGSALEVDNTRQSFFKPMASTYDKVRQVSVPHAEAANNYELRKDQYTGMGNVILEDLSKFNREDINRVMSEHRRAYREDGQPNLSGENDQKISDLLKQYYSKIADIRRELGIKIDGREAGKNEWYVPDMLNAKTLDLFINKPMTPEAKFAKNEWAEHAFKESEGTIPMDKIKKDITNYIQALNGKENNYQSLEFGAIRRAAGYGLPESLRDTDAVNTLARYSRRAAADLAFFQEIQSKPEIAGPLKIKNQDGDLYPDNSGVDLPESPLIQNMMQWVTGNVSGRIQNQPKLNATIRLVHNSLLGAATGIRDIVQVPVNSLPYINSFSDLGAAWKGLLDTRKNSRDALATAARQPSVDRIQFQDVLDAPDRYSTIVGKAADFMRKAQGREYLENLSRDITFSMGKELGRNNVLGAKAGNSKSVAWLKKFGDLVEGDVTKLEGEDLEKALNQIGKNFTDRNQGTYGGRGLPLGVVDNTFAPFFSLQKWSIEKSNVIYKDVWKPFMTGENRLPMLTYTLGSLMTGAAIQQLNELLSGRKGQDPTIKEALAKGDAQSIAQELATVMQLASFSGIMSDGLKAIADTTIRGKVPRNIVSFPTATAALRVEESVTDMFEAMRQGEDPWEVLKLFTLDMAVNNVQNARLLANRTWKSEDIERSDKFRDMRIYGELEGKPAKDFVKTNPYLGLEEKKFKRETDLGEAAKMAPKLVKKAVTEAKGNPMEAKRTLNALKGNSYQTVPSPETRPDEFQRYYEFLVKTQGKEAADERIQDFLKMRQINKAKSRMIP